MHQLYCLPTVAMWTFNHFAACRRYCDMLLPGRTLSIFAGHADREWSFIDDMDLHPRAENTRAELALLRQAIATELTKSVVHVSGLVRLLCAMKRWSAAFELSSEGEL